MKRLFHRSIDILLTMAAGAGAGYAVGALFVWLWAPAPTPENSSPPPEAFLFAWGAIIGFVTVVTGRLLFVPLWLRRRRRLG